MTVDFSQQEWETIRRLDGIGISRSRFVRKVALREANLLLQKLEGAENVKQV